MIRFVCASCGERLSVPDQQAGRRGQCPTCQGINRVPLKGFIEPRPSPAPPVVNAAQTAALPASPQFDDGAQIGAANSPSPGTPAFGSEAQTRRGEDERTDLAVNGGLPSAADDAHPEALPRTTGRDGQNDPGGSSGEMPAIASRPPRTLPRRLKQFLLVLAAIGIAATLYFGLLFALHMVLRAVAP